jgi:hypothetical protein
MHLLLLCNWGSKEVLPLGVVCNVPKKFADGPMNMALEKKGKSYEHTHELSNMITLLY